MHHEIIKRSHFFTRVSCSIASHTLSALATIVSQAQSVHAARDLSNAVTFSYLLSLFRIPCRHLHLKKFASQVGTCILNISQAHAVGTCITILSNAATFFLHVFRVLLLRIPCRHLQLLFRKPSWYLQLEIYLTQSLSVTCSLCFAYPVGTCT